MAQLYGILHHIVGNGHAPYQMLEFNDLPSGKHLVHPLYIVSSGVFNDRYLLVVGWIVQQHIEHKTVQLCFRQRIGAF